MARAHTGEIPGQLSLDDWEQTLSAAREAREPRQPDAGVDASAAVCAPGRKGAAVGRGAAQAAARSHSGAIELLTVPDALLTRTHLRALGLERRAVDAIFRALPVVALPGYSRPMIRAQEYVALIARSTYNGDTVRP